MIIIKEISWGIAALDVYSCFDIVSHSEKLYDMIYKEYKLRGN